MSLDILVARLTGQALLHEKLLAEDPGALAKRPAPEKWCALENLAHVARHHEVMLDRLRQMAASTELQAFAAYVPEQDPVWPSWQSLSPADVGLRLRALRQELVAFVEGNAERLAAMRGSHPAFGPLPGEGWLELFLVHEAHHQYLALRALGLAKR
jgi:hypothetical protein